jgi:peptidylprolyl isomerase
LKKGSLILVDLTARVKDTGEIIETTLESEAKKLGVYDESKKYEPRLISVGDGWVLKGVDDTLLLTKMGKKITKDMPPEKAFGLRDPDKVRRVPLRKLGEKAGELRVGDEVELDHRLGLVRFIGSGRAQIDFNHKYAGKVIIYDINPISELTTSDEQTMALVRRRLPIDAEKLSLKIRNGEVTINLPQEAFLAEGLQIIKRAASTDIFKHVNNVGKVTFIESYESPKVEDTKTSTKDSKKSKKPVTKKRNIKQAELQPKTLKTRKGSQKSS